jgi:hypothetical protein|tara:strand:- start:505 stop:1335 length:831 start_codon:yes stop_codon:yes gene_type:complete
MLSMLAMVTGCVSLTSSITSGLAEDLSRAILDNPDAETVRTGAPAYLILVDGLLARSPESVTLLSQAAALNSAYVGAFVSEPQRARVLAAKARRLAFRAACLGLDDGCALDSRPFEDLQSWLATTRSRDVSLLYAVGSAWAGWIQINSDDFNAIAELGRVKELMRRVVHLDEAYDHGGAHLYLGMFETILPPALGGRPEVGKAHFEKAIDIAEGRHLLTKVMFAENYARLVFNRELHDRLLNEVLEADAEQPGLTLINTVAKERAMQLLGSADAYF